jgi:hypothetical protein
LIVIDSVAKHCAELAKTIRPEDALEAVRLGLDPRKSIFSAYRQAVYRKTALLDDHVAAMWGVIGTPLSMTGIPYFITGTDAVRLSPVRFARLYTSEAKIMNDIFPVLENYVDASYTGAVKLLKLAGFTLEGPVMVNDNPFYKFKRTQ